MIASGEGKDRYLSFDERLEFGKIILTDLDINIINKEELSSITEGFTEWDYEKLKWELFFLIKKRAKLTKEDIISFIRKEFKTADKVEQEIAEFTVERYLWENR